MSLFFYEPFQPVYRQVQPALYHHYALMDALMPRYHNPWPRYQRRSLLDEMMEDLMDWTVEFVPESSHKHHAISQEAHPKETQKTVEPAQEQPVEPPVVEPPVVEPVEQPVKSPVDVAPVQTVVEPVPGHTDIVKTDNGYTIGLALGPVDEGVKEDYNVKVNAQTRMLSIKVTRSSEDENSKSYSSYTRSWSLPNNVDVDKLAETAQAKLIEENGQRTLQVAIELPQLPQREHVKEIPVVVKPTKSIEGSATMANEQPVDPTQAPEPVKETEQEVEEVESE